MVKRANLPMMPSVPVAQTAPRPIFQCCIPGCTEPATIYINKRNTCKAHYPSVSFMREREPGADDE